MKPPIQNAMVFGATSAIAIAFCRILAKHGVRLHLIGRDQDALHNLARDLELRGAKHVAISTADLSETGSHEQLVTQCWASLGQPGLVLLAHGSLGAQTPCETDWKQQHAQIQTNLLIHLSLLTILANKFEHQRSGCLAAISSVAADRGRASNYIYGTAKAGLSCYLEGLRSRLAPAGVRVVDLRPGPVDTPMTAGFPKGPLWSSPERVARAMVRALAYRTGTVYVPFYWRPIMWIVRVMPDIFIRRLGI